MVKNTNIVRLVVHCFFFRCTGFLGMKVGKITAICVGGGVILLQIAHHNGYVTINWNKVNNKIEKISDKVEEAVTGQGPHWMNKVRIRIIVFGYRVELYDISCKLIYFRT